MRRNQERRGYGLGLMPPGLRLLFVVFASSAFIFVHSIPLAVSIFVISGTVLILEPRIRHGKILLALLVANTVFMVVGNTLFSPDVGGGRTFLIFRFNFLGVHDGIVGALKRNAMLLLSFAWLSASRSFEEISASFAFIGNPGWQKFFLVFLKCIQNLTLELRTHYYSLLVRGIVRRGFSPRKRLLQMYLVLNAVVARFFRNVSKMTYVGESHLIEDRSQVVGGITVRKLGVRYGAEMDDVIVGLDIDFAVGEVVCLLGGCESGKTTLLRCLCGYIPRIAGEVFCGRIELGGRIIDDRMSLAEISGLVRYVGSSPKDYFLGLTVGQEIMTVAGSREDALRCLEAMGIADLWNLETTVLSGGQQARLLLAVALASRARIFLFDAPLAQLDSEGRKGFIAALERLLQLGESVVVLADECPDWYLPIANRYVLLEKGHVVKDLHGRFGTLREALAALEYSTAIDLAAQPQDFPLEGISFAELIDVGFQVDDHLILNRVSLNVRKNECLIILGPNGGGKTTAMLTLAGVLRPSSGERRASGVRFGFLFQAPEDQILESSCGGELGIGPRIQSWGEKERLEFVAEGILRLGVRGDFSTLELHPVRSRMLALLSSLAGIDVLILDEPTVEMDAARIAWFAREIRETLRRGISVIIVTHDERIFPLGSRFVFMDGGTVCAVEQNALAATRRYRSFGNGGECFVTSAGCGVLQ